MSASKIYKNFVYVGNQQIPFIDITIGSNVGSFSTLVINIPYSPYIQHLFPFTKIQVFEQITNNGRTSKATLEFDGVVVGISRAKNVLGQVGINLSCFTDGIIWERRKEYDYYLNEITEADTRGTEDVGNIRSEGIIGNYFNTLISKNGYDIGTAAACVLTSEYIQNSKGELTVNFIYNGKQFTVPATEQDTNDSDAGASIVGANYNPSSSPKYYLRYLDDFKLKNKVYGISTSYAIMNYFQTNNFIELITHNMGDLHGENSFHNIAQQVLNYGFHQFYDIPNPCYIKKTTNNPSPVNVGKDIPTAENFDPEAEVEYISEDQAKDNIKRISINSSNNFDGLAEYIFKPISVLGVPLKCNIIWPDQVIAENLSTDFLNSPTRVVGHRHPIEGISSENTVLTTLVAVGPVFKDSDQYFRSLTVDYDPDKPTFREGKNFSDFEAQFGVAYSPIDISTAFDNALLRNLTNEVDTSKNTLKTIRNLNNYLNYEFSQKFFNSRKYSIQITPDCNPVIGSPVIIMEEHGQHIIAFCLSITKYYSAMGQKTVNLGLSYPRYYYENMGLLGNVVDPTCSDPNALAEMETILGSDAICSITTANSNTSSNTLKAAIDRIFNKWHEDTSDNKETIKTMYSRKNVCTIQEYLDHHDAIGMIGDNPPENLGIAGFKSNIQMKGLSTNCFSVWDYDRTDSNPLSTKKETRDFGTDPSHPGLSNETIVQYHIQWTKQDQRI